MALIECQNVTLGYDNKAIVRNLNFTVGSGDYLCILGENGSGKSTLMKTLLGLKSPLEGRIIYGDGLNKKEIGYLPQQTVVQKDFPASVREIVLSGCLGKKGAFPFYTEADRKLADKNMERMDITHLSRKCYRELSGGQQQRVLLARALCAAERIILLDEPVSGLDPKVTAEMYTLIEQLNSQGITVIMISHDVNAALMYATHILHIGSDIFFGTRSDYVKSSSAASFIAGGEHDG